MAACARDMTSSRISDSSAIWEMRNGNEEWEWEWEWEWGMGMRNGNEEWEWEWGMGMGMGIEWGMGMRNGEWKVHLLQLVNGCTTTRSP